MRSRIFFIFIFAVCLVPGVFADSGRVTRIMDGDTLEILTADKQTLRVRLLEIDAPEKNQAFGQKSRDTLAELCAGKEAVLKQTGKDQYKRTLARVYCEGVDANLVMVERGMAWAYVRYAKDPAIFKAEKSARKHKTGLWVDADPVPPWEFRRKQ